jgi:hypothetical protein
MIDTALPEILRVLRQDRGHVVLVVSRELVSELVACLTRELVDSMRVGIARFASRDESSAAECVLSTLGVLSAEEPPIRARIELERLAQLGSSLTLLIPGALSVDPRVLRDLGELATRSGNALRLALIAERDLDVEEDPAALLVSALGTGAAKIDVEPPARPPSESPANTPVGPPRVAPPRPTRRARPIPVRSTRRARRRAEARARGRRGLLATAVVAVAALPISLWALSPSGDPVKRPPVASPAAPYANSSPLFSAADSPPVSSAGEVVAVAASPMPLHAISHESTEPSLPREVEVTKLSEAAPETPPKPDVKPALTEEAVARPRPKAVPVNLNARPYAEIEVDGTAIGPTPIANHPLAPGWHDVRAVFPDGRVSEQRIRVDSLENHFRIR